MKNYTFDATKMSAGRLATQIASVLQGKNLATYDPKDLVQVQVKVINVSKLSFTGKKFSQKMYYRHAGALGHLKERKIKDVFAKNPARVLEMAVRRMLPKNRLQSRRMKMLKFDL